ncbi:sodium:solute symporter family protein [Endozoicomonas euniceicola]|uniref:Sodium:solute symporter family protein n=1 Tax=Endozoicomonas euniceicola TaxID=1234143 RepID=A0ABY6GRR9_9GAMM|nr:sodium:solute symporter family protein [Endozoicomonas euniceicola]UYM15445.1 sodium:solute symporter family protein [Endozoicomonas euniceicola]
MVCGESGKVTLQLGLIIVYFLLLLPVCLKAKQSSTKNTASDHYLADRSLGMFVLSLTLFATIASGHTLLANTGQAYRLGYHWIMAMGLWTTISVSYRWIVPKLRPIALTNHFVTPGDWIRFRFPAQPWAVPLRQLLTLCFCLCLTNYLFAQLKAVGEIVVVLTDSKVPYHLAVPLFALVILLYDSVGGLRAVAWTDVIQGLVTIAGVACLCYWITSHFGGLQQIIAGVAEHRPESARVPDYTFQARWFSLMLMGGLAVCVYPQALQRVFAASSTRVLYRSLALSNMVLVICGLVLILTGWSSLSLLGGASISEDQVLTVALKQWAASSAINYFGASLVLMAVMAAIMSTADSVLLSLVSIIKHDFTQTSARTSLRQDYLIAFVVMTLCSLAALYRDITLWRLLELKLELLVQCFPGFALALHRPSLRASSVFLGLATGLVVLITELALGVRSVYGINSGMVALAANITGIFIHHVAVIPMIKKRPQIL